MSINVDVLLALNELRAELSVCDEITMDVVDDLIQKVISNKNYEKSTATKYEKVIENLMWGKRLKIEKLKYVYPSTPYIKVVGLNNEEDTLELDCIPKGEFETYMVEKPVEPLDSVTVTSYKSGDAVPIEYIYANPQMNRLFAHLANGEDVSYSLSILDVNRVGDEYIKD